MFKVAKSNIYKLDFLIIYMKKEKTEWDLLFGYGAGLWILTTTVFFFLGGGSLFDDLYSLIAIPLTVFSAVMILVGTKIADEGKRSMGGMITIIFSFIALIGYGGLFIGSIMGLIGGFKQLEKKKKVKK